MAGAALACGVSRSTLYRGARNGTLKARHLCPWLYYLGVRAIRLHQGSIEVMFDNEATRGRSKG